MPRQCFVYILTNKSNSVLYIGVTNNLRRRLQEHQNCLHPDSFTARYNIHKLVYYEVADRPMVAISREKELKGWVRYRKVDLVQSMNPDWKDLGVGLCG